MSDYLDVCSHIYELVRDMSLRGEGVQNVRCVACDTQVSADQVVPATELLQLLRTDDIVVN